MTDKNPNKAFKRPIDDSPAPEATEIIVKLAKKPMTYAEAQKIYGNTTHTRHRLYNSTNEEQEQSWKRLDDAHKRVWDEDISTREEREDAFDRMNEDRGDR